MRIPIKVEGKRGCGYRKPGGLYLMSDGLPMLCGKLPLPLQVCPTCGGGVKPSRGWTWVNPQKLFPPGECPARGCASCPVGIEITDSAGLLWIGEGFYPTPGHWTREALEMGASRRISSIPRGLKLNETWVFVAHRKAIPMAGGEYTPGIFHAFIPSAIEYVVKGDETEKELEALEKRGVTPVKIERAGETLKMAL